MVLLFCPNCGNLLGVEEGAQAMQFVCETCPYVSPVTKKVRQAQIEPKHKLQSKPQTELWSKLN